MRKISVAGCWLLVAGYWMLDTGCWFGKLMCEKQKVEMKREQRRDGEIILKAKSYRDLEIYQISYELAMKIHAMSLELPRHELYEEGNQIRKSSKGVCATIVEGYGRRRYKNDFIKFLVYAQASCDETGLHLDFIYDSEYIADAVYGELKEYNDKLGKKINRFIQYVEKEWKA